MLVAKDLSYRNGKTFLINQINHIYKPGMIYGLLGPNGSGKTTLLKALSGIWKPTEGEVFWNEAPLLQYSRREIAKILTLVSQSPVIQFDYAVAEVVAMGRYPYGAGGRGVSSQVNEALKTVDAYHLINRSITQLSHGERQRIFLARALVTESPVLLLDEPTTNLDIRHQMEIWELLKKLADNGKTIVIANHDLTASEKYCNEIMVMEKGKCVAQGCYRDTLNEEILRTVFGVQENEVVIGRTFSLAKS